MKLSRDVRVMVRQGRTPSARIVARSTPGRMLQRLRVTFSRGEEVKYVSHLDLMRLWERTLGRASIPLAYSQGYSPHPKISLAAPLPVGVTSEAELMDLFLGRRVSPLFFAQKVSEQLPRGIEILETQEVGLALPSLQSQVRYAEYRVSLETDKGAHEVQAALRSLLTLESLPWQRVREMELRKFDLRELIDDLWLIGYNVSTSVLGMRLRTDNTATGRPDDVLAALGLDDCPSLIHRTRLILAESKPLKLPFQRGGRRLC